MEKDCCYYSKVQFDFYVSVTIKARILLNVIAGELSYQEFDSHGDVTISKGMNLSENQIEEIMPYLDTAKFEPYRHRDESFDEIGICGYYDEIRAHFIGVSNSPVPMINLYMNMIHDDKHLLPTEKLLNYLCLTFFSDKEHRNAFVYGIANRR